MPPGIVQRRPTLPAVRALLRGRVRRRFGDRLREELAPFLESMIRTVTLIQREIYGEG